MKTIIFPEVLYFEEEKEIRKLPTLKLITGGKGEPPASSGNWLKDLEVGTVFFVEDKRQINNPIIESFWLLNKEGPGDKLIILLPQRAKSLEDKIIVNPYRFCNIYNFYHSYGVIEVPKEKDIKEVKTPYAREEGNE